MDFFNRFIDWKKNIKPIQYDGLNIFFDRNKTTFENLLTPFERIYTLLPDEELKFAINKNQNHWIDTNYGKRLVVEINHDESKSNIFKSFGIVEYINQEKFKWLSANYLVSELNSEFIGNISK